MARIMMKFSGDCDAPARARHRLGTSSVPLCQAHANSAARTHHSYTAPFAMRKLLYILISAAIPLSLLFWSEKPGRNVPDWVMLVAFLPLAWFSLRDDLENGGEDAPTSGWVLLYLFFAGLFLIVVGTLAWAIVG